MLKKIYENKYARNIVVVIVLVGVGFGVGYYHGPNKVVTKIEQKEVIKYVEAKKEDKNIVVIKKKITQKDGTVIEESREEDKTKITTDIRLESEKELKISEKKTKDLGLSINALMFANVSDIKDREYGLLVKKRVLGNISVGGLVTDKHTVGISVGLDF